MFDRLGNRKYLNGRERRSFLLAILTEKNDLRRAFCLTMFHSGCRITEALKLSVTRIDLNQKTIVFETLKQRRQGCFRSVPIPDDLAKLFKKLIINSEPSALIWNFSRPTAYRLVKGYMAQAGIKGGMNSPKGLRHGFAVACIGQGIPLTSVKKWMGHARLETTAIYLDVSGEEERDFAKRLWED